MFKRFTIASLGSTAMGRPSWWRGRQSSIACWVALTFRVSSARGSNPMHGRPGLYRATIDCRWDRGSLARVLAGEDPAVELTARDVETEGFEVWPCIAVMSSLGMPPRVGG